MGMGVVGDSMTAYVARPVMACIDGRHQLCTRDVYTTAGVFAGWCPCPCHRRTVPLREQERQLKADGVEAGKAWAEFQFQRMVPVRGYWFSSPEHHTHANLVDTTPVPHLNEIAHQVVEGDLEVMKEVGVDHGGGFRWSFRHGQVNVTATGKCKLDEGAA